ncbi:MAG: SMC-Scp complex subunit ScpB [Porticoccaceae bacterium]
MDSEQLRKIIEAAILAAGRSLDIADLAQLFDMTEQPDKEQIRAALEDIEADCKDRGYELKQTASGYRFQVRKELGPWISRMWEEKPKKYSRALLETLALIAYRQPITRGEIEDVRGVSVSSEIIKTLLERDWVRVVGHRDVPGKPALFATTRQFLDYFNLKSLNQLPPLSDIKDLASIDPELALAVAADELAAGAGEPSEDNPEASDDSVEGYVDDNVESDIEDSAEDSTENQAEPNELDQDEFGDEQDEQDEVRQEESSVASGSVSS